MVDVTLITVALLVGVITWLRADPNRKERAAAWLACGWILPSVTFFDFLSTYLGIWPTYMPLIPGRAPLSFWPPGNEVGALSWTHVLVFGSPLIVLVWRVVMWGWVPALLFPRLDMRLVYVFGFLVDQCFLRFSLMGLSLSLNAAVFHAVGAAACLLPAQFFSRWTRERSYLPVRVWMHFIFHSTLLLGILSMVILSLAGGFEAPFLRSSVVNKLLLQLLLIPAVLLASAMREFYFGGGTPMPADAPLRLVDTGPYAYVANPMQIGKFGVLTAWGIFWGSPGIFGAAGFGLLYSVMIASRREDQEMLARFGTEWTRYRKEVRRWWPRWRPYCAGANAPTAANQAQLYLDANCGPCAELARWFKRQNPTGLRVMPIASRPGEQLGRMTYSRAEGGVTECGIRALGRGLEHINALWAFFGWILGLPMISWMAQLIADAVTIGTRTGATRVCAIGASAFPGKFPNAVFTQSVSVGNNPYRSKPQQNQRPELPLRSQHSKPAEPMVWVVAGLSAVLLLLVCVTLFWKGSTSELMWQLRHGSASNRLEAAQELARIGQTAIAAAPALKEALQDSDIRVQTIAADALLRMQAWQELNSSEWVRKADRDVITSAMTNIANTFPPPLSALPVLETVLRNHPTADVRSEAVLTLGHYGERAIPALQEALGDADPSVQRWAQTVLQRIQPRNP